MLTFPAVRLTVDLSEVEREKTQEMELRFPGEEGRSLLVLLTITGTSPLQPGCPRRDVSCVRYQVLPYRMLGVRCEV